MASRSTPTSGMLHRNSSGQSFPTAASSTPTATTAAAASNSTSASLSSASGSGSTDDYIWQDREVRFDVPPVQLNLRRGEFEIDVIKTIEDTKGNNGDQGALFITNLRMIWISHKSNKINLCIGYNCIVSISIHPANSKLGGHTEALFCLTKFNGNRYEFIFTNILKGTPRLFTTVQAVHCAYESSRLYRDLKLRGAIIRDHELNLLPKEEIYNRITGVWNLSSDQGNLGTFVITNVRLVWFANMAENFNVSVPYLQMKSVKIRNSKFGPALVIETSRCSGSYVLGFRIDPEDSLQSIFKEIQSLQSVFTTSPIFGIDFVKEEIARPIHELTVPRRQDDVEIVEDRDLESLYSSVYVQGNKPINGEPIFCPHLGLAIENTGTNIDVQQIWNIFG